jgi:hypothetical protein
VRTLKRNSIRNLSWKMPIAGPVMGFAVALLAIAVAFMWR